MDHGDWNDGMNRVGSRGKGESIWLAWFSIVCRTRFAAIALDRGDTKRSEELRGQAEELRQAIEATAWDGQWYLRAFFDDGTPLGSAKSKVCQIDSIAQTWAVLSGAGDPEHTRQAMQATNDRLVREADQLIMLFDPPFDADSLDPGYIKGYLPGIRENGGQYTHAATWVVEAAALQGEGQRAYQLLRILNPVLHAADQEGLDRYKVEPYVIAGDVYSHTPHAGRGGWTWYSGSAGWFYRVIVESILGLARRGDRLEFNPRVPPEWSHYEIRYRFRSTTYSIKIENPAGVESGVASVWLDNARQPGNGLRLVDDAKNHDVRVVMGAAESPDALARFQ
jgi:cellobiose phosphorylase